jgi:thymidylate kinase
MRLILTGCEYAGKSTLAGALHAWGQRQGFQFHLDDHFTVPDSSLRTDEERRHAAAAPPAMKERFQRFQIYYHLHILEDYADCLLGGFHIEEAIYGRRYYYPKNVWPSYTRALEHSFPRDTILLLLKARPEVIRRRMQE